MQQDLFDKEPVRSRPKDPETSHEAAIRVQEFSAQMYKKIHNELLMGDGTYEELADRLNFRRDQLSKRLPEMERIGIVQLTGEKRAGSSGRMQRVWRATKE
jgi:predicted transcriptional regulator